MWCIPPKQDAAFACAMEQVPDVCTRPHDPSRPVVRMDETTKQCVREKRVPRPAAPGRPARFDAECERNGVAHLLLHYAPLENWRRVDVKGDHVATTWAEGARRLVEEDFPDAERITLVMDNLNTHAGASLYKAFEPATARRLLGRLEFVNTPKHGSWLNMAEVEFSALGRQCLDRHLPDVGAVRREAEAWTKRRNAGGAPVQWRFTTEDARIKLRGLYPKMSD